MKMINRKTLLAAAFVAAIILLSFVMSGCWAVAGSTECFFGSPNCNAEVTSDSDASTDVYSLVSDVDAGSDAKSEVGSVDSSTETDTTQCLPAGHFMTKYVGRTVYCVIGDSGVAGLECGPVQILSYQDGICGFGCAGLPAGASLDEIKEESGGFRFVRFNGTTAHCKPVDTADTDADATSDSSVETDTVDEQCPPADSFLQNYKTTITCAVEGGGLPYDCNPEYKVDPEQGCFLSCQGSFGALLNELEEEPGGFVVKKKNSTRHCKLSNSSSSG